MAGESPHYTRYIRKQPCDACGTTHAVEPHHAISGTTYSPDEPKPPKAIEGARKGKSQRSHDYFALPLCLKCHEPGIHQRHGFFEGWTTKEIASWEQERVAFHRAEYAREFPNGEPSPAIKAKPSGVGLLRATDAISIAWRAGANAERRRIAEWLFETAARIGAPDAHQALIDAHELLRSRTEPMATP